MARDLETLDAAIKLVAPDLEIEAIAPKFTKPPEDWSRRGEMSRQVLSILRTSTKLSNGVQKGPPIGVEEGPPFQII